MGTTTRSMDIPRRPLRYPGEDTTPTSDREIRGWYSYGIAAEVFAVVGVGSFLPITLEQLARERGVLRSDGVTSCIAKPRNPVARQETARLWSSLFSRDLVKRESLPCVIHLFGKVINTSSFTLYTFSLATLCQAFALVSLSAIADHGGNRKRLLLILSLTGAASSMLFLLVVPEIYLVGSLLAIIGVTCLGTTFVLLNSFLPLLVASHPSISGRLNGEDDDSIPLDSSSSTQSLPRARTSIASVVSPALKLSNQISSRGIGLGYAAAVLMQMCSIAILITFNMISPSNSKTTIPMRIILFLVGLWWAIFTIPSALCLRSRPGPQLPPDIYLGRGRFWHMMWHLTFAWMSLWRTIKVAAKLRQVVIFLIAWFLLSDATGTISGVAILFARTELQMGTEALAGLSLTATASGIAGAFYWPIIGRKLGLESKYIIVMCICLFEIIPLYGLLGFVPFIQKWGVGGLQQSFEIYPLGFLLGFVQGGLSSYCRAVFGTLIPPRHEAAFYALMAVTDKGSSAIGPAIVGRIVDSTGSIRMSFWFSSVLVVLPAPLFWILNLEQGRKDAVLMANTYNKSIDLPSSDDLGRLSYERQELLADEIS